MDQKEYNYGKRCIWQLMDSMNHAKFWRHFESEAFLPCLDVPKLASIQNMENHVLYSVIIPLGRRNFLLEKGEYFQPFTFDPPDPVYIGLYAVVGSQTYTTLAGAARTVPVLRLIMTQQEMKRLEELERNTE